MSVEHHTVSTEREYAHAVSVVFAAWADPVVKRRWFELSDDPEAEWVSDLREGGREHFATPPGARPEVRYEAVFSDVVAEQRIVATSDITVDGRRTSVSVSTVEFDSLGTGSSVRVTEQVVFLDGLEGPDSRTGGVRSQLERLASYLGGGEGT